MRAQVCVSDGGESSVGHMCDVSDGPVGPLRPIGELYVVEVVYCLRHGPGVIGLDYYYIGK